MKRLITTLIITLALIFFLMFTGCATTGTPSQPKSNQMEMNCAGESIFVNIPSGVPDFSHLAGDVMPLTNEVLIIRYLDKGNHYYMLVSRTECVVYALTVFANDDFKHWIYDSKGMPHPATGEAVNTLIKKVSLSQQPI